MSLLDLMATPCTIIRRQPDTGLGPFEDLHDDYGNPIYTETSSATVCSLQQARRAEEDVAISDTVWNLYLPTGTALDTSDRVTVGSFTYEVVGQPWDATMGSSQVHHVEATLRRVAGAEDT